jgi:hypothetical protein
MAQSRRQMATKDKTAAELLDEVARRGYSVGYLHETMQMLQEAADWCNIKDVLTWHKDVGRGIASLSLQSWEKPPGEAGDDRALLYALDDKLTEEVLATLKAKQCKCG